MDEADRRLKAELEAMTDEQLTQLIIRCRTEERRKRDPANVKRWVKHRRLATGVLATRAGLMPERRADPA
jgi:hypothetical protein